ncbi:MAG: N-glycosylase [Clostridiales bacterium]|nr:N-glycosylase [Clostridiales bacterium]
MEYRQAANGIKILNLRDFDIAEILECGQCFRFEKVSKNFYFLVAFGQMLYIRQFDSHVEFWYEGRRLDIDEFKAIWEDYFDLKRDYGAIKAEIAKNDPIMQRAIDFAPGIRLLQQDPWETLISFIISQNNRIPQIKQVIKNIAAAFGDPIDGENFAFPTTRQLSTATAEDLRALKAGFRDKYILAATTANLPLTRDNALTTEELRKMLLSIKGIGEKVAHCVLLFGYGRYDSFPVDVWVRRVMENLYFDGKKTSPAQILAHAQNKFGQNAGFANQYLFHYVRKTYRHDEYS